jgi:hypothetical protein
MTEQEEAGAIALPTAATQERQRSTIAFPYVDLQTSIQLAKAIFDNVAGGECDDDQLAAWTSQSPKSSGFRTQVYGARMFGVVVGEASRHRLTELGKTIIDPQKEREAKVRAFLSVPLYAALFDKFKGNMLPPPAALEREIEGLGVASKQKDRARQVFERAADQAGFFEHGRNRLVQPGIALTPGQPEDQDAAGNSGSGGGGNGGGDGSNLDPLISALLLKLPKPADKFPKQARATWLQMMAMAFEMAYGPAGEIEIKAKQDGQET